MPDEIGDLLRFDPIATAERLTGRVGGDPGMLASAAWLASAHADAKQYALTATGDTWDGSRFDEHLAVFEALGFQRVLDDPFTGRDDQVEHFVVLWHPDGILGSCESYGSTRATNSSHIVYAWRPHDPEGDWCYRLVSSGGLENGVWYGYHDTREGLRHTIAGFRGAGEFVSPWERERRWPYRWTFLGTYMEWDGGKGRERWDEVRAARFNRLPREIREALGVPEATA